MWLIAQDSFGGSATQNLVATLLMVAVIFVLLAGAGLTGGYFLATWAGKGISAVYRWLTSREKPEPDDPTPGPVPEPVPSPPIMPSNLIDRVKLLREMIAARKAAIEADQRELDEANKLLSAEVPSAPTK